MSAEVKNGELYSGDKTDIYCIGACLYNIVIRQILKRMKNEDYLNNNLSE